MAGLASCLLGALAVGVLALVLAAPPAWAARTVYVANLGSEARPGESVSAFSIASGGSLSALVGSPFLTGGAGALGAAVTPDGRYLYVTNFASESVSAFSIGSDGSLSAVPGSPFAAGYGPWGMAISPDGGYLYVVDWEGLVSALSIAADGSLSAVPGSPFATGGESPSGVAVTPDGGHLYVANQSSEHGSGSVAAFSIAADGSLAAVPGSPFAASAARALAVTPDGAYLYVASQANGPDPLFAFSIASDGSLTAVPGSPFAVEENSLVGVAVSPDGEHLYAANRGNSQNHVLRVFDRRRREPERGPGIAVHIGRPIAEQRGGDPGRRTPVRDQRRIEQRLGLFDRRRWESGRGPGLAICDRR